MVTVAPVATWIAPEGPVVGVEIVVVPICVTARLFLSTIRP